MSDTDRIHNAQQPIHSHVDAFQKRTSKYFLNGTPIRKTKIKTDRLISEDSKAFSISCCCWWWWWSCSPEIAGAPRSCCCCWCWCCYSSSCWCWCCYSSPLPPPLLPCCLPCCLVCLPFALCTRIRLCSSRNSHLSSLFFILGPLIALILPTIRDPVHTPSSPVRPSTSPTPPTLPYSSDITRPSSAGVDVFINNLIRLSLSITASIELELDKRGRGTRERGEDRK